uniref:(northern house mosquito) hypothetical protein n=1 Tax=Culex pipiens TaxID=7175 RepID=A0A8D8K5K9_CULPI
MGSCQSWENYSSSSRDDDGNNELAIASHDRHRPSGGEPVRGVRRQSVLAGGLVLAADVPRQAVLPGLHPDEQLPVVLAAELHQGAVPRGWDWSAVLPGGVHR